MTSPPKIPGNNGLPISPKTKNITAAAAAGIGISGAAAIVIPIASVLVYQYGVPALRGYSRVTGENSFEMEEMSSTSFKESCDKLD